MKTTKLAAHMSAGAAVRALHGRRSAAAAGAILLTLALTGGLTAAASAPSTGRRPPGAVTAQRAALPAIPQPGKIRGLDAVRCTSRTNCWAMGGYVTGQRSHSQALHWNGRGWTRVGTPSPGTAYTEPESVGCLSPSNCWAVGRLSDGTDGDSPVLTFAMHWNGHAWSAVPTPNPGGTAAGDTNDLRSVSCLSAKDCWAVGSIGPFSASEDLVLHWDGRSWDPATPSSTSNGQLYAVRCTSVRNCWAVGVTTVATSATFHEFDQVLHWNGRAWSAVPTPQPGSQTRSLAGVSCTSAASCWAVGTTGGVNDSPVLTQALHWNGRSWRVVPTPNPAGHRRNHRNILDSVSCRSARNCWAVGFGTTGFVAAVSNQILHWNGTRWSAVRTPDPGGTTKFSNNHLYAISCATVRYCWAAGTFSRSAEVPHHDPMNLLLRWNGTRWAR